LTAGISKKNTAAEAQQIKGKNHSSWGTAKKMHGSSIA
jgi:hypothetical protein